MIFVRRADEFVIGGVHQIPDPSDLSRHIVHILFRRYTCLLSLQFDLLPVLIRAGLEEYVVALAPLISCDRVRQDDLIRVPDMRLSRRIGNSRRHIIFWFFTHNLLSLLKHTANPLWPRRV